MNTPTSEQTKKNYKLLKHRDRAHSLFTSAGDAIRFSHEGQFQAAATQAFYDLEQELLADQQANNGPVYRHKKRGTEYIVIGEGKMQAPWAIMNAMSIEPVDMEPVIIYRGTDGQIWVRPKEEFEDGRFEKVSDAKPSSNGWKRDMENAPTEKGARYLVLFEKEEPFKLGRKGEIQVARVGSSLIYGSEYASEYAKPTAYCLIELPEGEE